jgi:hypothetical protein
MVVVHRLSIAYGAKLCFTIYYTVGKVPADLGDKISP